MMKYMMIRNPKKRVEHIQAINSQVKFQVQALFLLSSFCADVDSVVLVCKRR